MRIKSMREFKCRFFPDVAYEEYRDSLDSEQQIELLISESFQRINLKNEQQLTR